MYEELLISGEEIATENPKIFKSIEQFPTNDVINQTIEEIKLAIANHDHNKIITIFATHVEGYSS